MKTRIILAALALAALATAAAARTQVLEETSEDQFSAGEAQGVVPTSLGTLRLGRALEDVLAQTEGVDYVARMAEGPDGAVYAVTGGTGRVYRIAGGKATLLATLEDAFLFSVLADKNGDVYVGGGGAKGRVWRIVPQPKGEAKAEVLYEADDVKYVWDLVWLPDGALAAATGDKGKVLRLTPDKKSSVLLDSEATHVLCLAVTPDGALIAGTDSEALVYRLAGGKTFVLYDAAESEITALAADAAGNVYVGTSTGGAGRTGGVTVTPAAPKPAGAAAPPAAPEKKEPEPGSAAPAAPDKAADEAKPEPPAAAPDAAAPKPDAGAEQKPGEKADEPKDKPEEKPADPAAPQSVEKPEAAAEKKDAPAEEKPTPAAEAPPAPPVAKPADAPKPPAPSTVRPTPRSKGGGAVVYRIAPDGVVTPLFESGEGMVLALAVAGDRLLVGTGNAARLYEVALADHGEEACLTSVDPKQVMTLAVTKAGRILAGTAGPGRIYALSKGYAKEGTYTSRVHDAGGSARWGALKWLAGTPDGTQVLVATRSGNVKEPDKGMWSEWSKPLAKTPASIESPAARFIQFRVTMKTRDDSATPVLEEFAAAYLRANEAPHVESIAEVPRTTEQRARAQAVQRFVEAMQARTHPPSTAKPAQGAAPPPPPPEGPQPVRVLQWKAADPNGDALRFDVYVRLRGEPVWVPLDKDLERPEYAWDTGTVADGWYEVKVVASDRADRPAETALEDERTSDPILVDNTAPVVERIQADVRGRDVEVRFSARDAASRLTEAAYTVDSSTAWRTLAPTDGLFDAQAEEFRFVIRDLPPGAHHVGLRVVDENNNRGHAARSVMVEAK
jgi:hypothetical protein